MNAHAQWLGPSDPARREAFARAMTVSSAGSVLLQTTINKLVTLLTLRELGVQAVIDRKPGSGNAAYVNRRAAGTTGATWVADTDSATDETGTYTQVSFTYKTLIGKGSITRKLMAAGRPYGDVLATELVGKTEDFANVLEFGMISGDHGAAGNANQFDGLLTLINNVSGQVIAQTSASAGDALTLAKLDATIDHVRGAGVRSDLVIICSQLGARKLNAALQGSQRFNDVTEVGAGFRVRAYDQIPIVVSTQMPDILTWSGTSITALTGGSTTAILVFNKRHAWYEELTPTTVMPLARTTSQNEAFELYNDGVIVLHNTLGGAILGGIVGS